MIKYTKADVNYLQNKNIVIYGAGSIGMECFDVLKQNKLNPVLWSDSDKSKWGRVIHGIEIVPPEKLKGIADLLVVIAIDNFIEPYNYVVSLGIRDVAIYCIKEIMLCKEIDDIKFNSLGCFSDYLNGRDVILYGESKHIQDIQYIFETFENADTIEEYSLLPNAEENSVLIVCNKYTKEEKQRLIEKGYAQGTTLFFIEDILPLLDIDNKIKGKMPSLMLYKTIFDSMKDQYKCSQPFYKMQLASDLSVHCCCGDWADSWGYLNYNTMQEIWDSVIAKIFRLSIVNRTYTFCKERRCVHLKVNPKKSTERIFSDCIVPPIPTSIEVGIDKTCNLYCASCRNCVIVESGSKLEKIKSITEDIKASGWLDKTEFLLLGGQGEVFVSPVYRSLMFDGVEKRKKLELRTNGTAFKEEDILNLLEKYEQLMIIVSIDAATRETYDMLRRSKSKDTYDRLMNNMMVLSKLRKSGKIHHLQINMCVQMLNYKEMPDFVKYGNMLGCDMIYITPIRNWGTYSEDEFKSIGIFVSDKVLKPEVAEIAEQIRNEKNVIMEF